MGEVPCQGCWDQEAPERSGFADWAVGRVDDLWFPPGVLVAGRLMRGSGAARRLSRTRRAPTPSEWLPISSCGVPGEVRDVAGQGRVSERDHGVEEIVELFRKMERLLFAAPCPPPALRERRVPVEDVGKSSQLHATIFGNDTEGGLEFVSVDRMRAGQGPHVGEVAPAGVHGPRRSAVTSFSAWTIGSG